MNCVLLREARDGLELLKDLKRDQDLKVPQLF
jgi:hypothetical protein